MKASMATFPAHHILAPKGKGGENQLKTRVEEGKVKLWVSHLALGLPCMVALCEAEISRPWDGKDTRREATRPKEISNSGQDKEYCFQSGFEYAFTERRHILCAQKPL